MPSGFLPPFLPVLVEEDDEEGLFKVEVRALRGSQRSG
jgi:hypothetical protein